MAREDDRRDSRDPDTRPEYAERRRAGGGWQQSGSRHEHDYDERGSDRDGRDRGYGAWDPRQYGYGTPGDTRHQHGAEYREYDRYGRPVDAEARDVRDRDRAFARDPARDQAASWFGDEDARHGRYRDDHRGRGPKGYTRSDERIREDVCDRLTEDPFVDASDVEIAVAAGEVTLSGTVHGREERRRAEDCVERVAGVRHVQNNLRVQRPGAMMGATGSGVTSGIVPSGTGTTPGVASGSATDPRGDGGRH